MDHADIREFVPAPCGARSYHLTTVRVAALPLSRHEGQSKLPLNDIEGSPVTLLPTRVFTERARVTDPGPKTTESGKGLTTDDTDGTDGKGFPTSAFGARASPTSSQSKTQPCVPGALTGCICLRVGDCVRVRANDPLQNFVAYATKFCTVHLRCGWLTGQGAGPDGNGSGPAFGTNRRIPGRAKSRRHKISE